MFEFRFAKRFILNRNFNVQGKFRVNSKIQFTWMVKLTRIPYFLTLDKFQNFRKISLRCKEKIVKIVTVFYCVFFNDFTDKFKE